MSILKIDDIDGEAIDPHHKEWIIVKAIRGGEKLLEIAEAVDALLQGRELVRRGAVALFHLPVVLEKRDVVGRGFDPEYQTELVVHLDRHGAHLVLQARAQPAFGQAIAQFILVIAMQFTA